MDIPTGIDHIKMISKLNEVNRQITAEKLDNYNEKLKILGISLSILYQTSTCHRKCFGGPHILESLSGRIYNLACSAYTLICRGFYDEALNLIRSIGEISNLIMLSVVDKKSLAQWLSSDKKARMKNFTPSKIRILLEKYDNGALMYVDKDWYSKFCEDYTHVHPKTVPNNHNADNEAHIGGFVQEEGMKFSIEELTSLCSQIAMIVSKYADLDDMFDELCTSLGLVKDIPTTAS